MNTKNFWATIGTIFTIFGIFLALYYGKEKKREPVYSVIKTPSLIFDRFNASPKIKLIVNDSLTLAENVYITTLVIWNKGKLPINKEDIRQDLFIYCSDSTSKILDFKIIEEKESGVSNFKLIPKKEDLKIDWDYFDPGFGFKFQVIYTGNDLTKIVVSGNVLGSKVKQLKTKSKEGELGRNLLIIFVFVFAVFGSIAIWYAYFKSDRALSKLIINWSVQIMIVSLVIQVFSKFMELIFAIGMPF